MLPQAKLLQAKYGYITPSITPVSYIFKPSITLLEVQPNRTSSTARTDALCSPRTQSAPNGRAYIIAVPIYSPQNIGAPCCLPFALYFQNPTICHPLLKPLCNFDVLFQSPIYTLSATQPLNPIYPCVTPTPCKLSPLD